jgi:prepilin-type N-terminal cleavage/methylation domain-containing protein
MYCQKNENSKKTGFTLIELSIVLVIIGLVAGGIFVGKDLINTAMVNSQIKQIQQTMIAINTFKAKYGYLPGDLPSDKVDTLAFTPRSSGMNDMGNYVIQGYYGLGATNGFCQSGEPVLFWADLGDADLIPKLAVATSDRVGNTYTYIDGTTNSYSLADILPKAAIGNGGFMYIWSGGPGLRWNNLRHNGKNYLGIAAISSIEGGTDSTSGVQMNMTPLTAYQLDSKIDDGKPQAGKITAIYVDGAIQGGEPMVVWAHGNRTPGGASCRDWWCNETPNAPTGAPTPADENTCYDNNNLGGETHYSTSTNSNNLNCAFSIELPQ